MPATHLRAVLHDEARRRGHRAIDRRSIVEAHAGRLWATVCGPLGALFQFNGTAVYKNAPKQSYCLQVAFKIETLACRQREVRCRILPSTAA